MEDFKEESLEDFEVVNREVDLYYLDESETCYVEHRADAFILCNEECTIDLNESFEVEHNTVIQKDAKIPIPDHEAFMLLYKKILIGGLS